jgi:hypothetical protein
VCLNRAAWLLIRDGNVSLAGTRSRQGIDAGDVLTLLTGREASPYSLVNYV